MGDELGEKRIEIDQVEDPDVAVVRVEVGDVRGNAAPLALCGRGPEPFEGRPGFVGRQDARDDGDPVATQFVERVLDHIRVD